MTRRYFLGQGAGVGIGAMALSGLLGRQADCSDVSASDSLPHFAPKAKRVIFLTQSGGPSQLEL
ncbi:MAG: sulfatase, partial [Rubripirellula sp.]